MGRANVVDKVDLEVIKNMDLLLSYDALTQESNWDLLEALETPEVAETEFKDLEEE